MPRPKRLEKLRIWLPGAAIRAAVGVRRRGFQECRRGGAAGFQVFRFSESGRSDFQARGLLTTEAVRKRDIHYNVAVLVYGNSNEAFHSVYPSAVTFVLYQLPRFHTASAEDCHLAQPIERLLHEKAGS